MLMQCAAERMNRAGVLGQLRGHVAAQLRGNVGCQVTEICHTFLMGFAVCAPPPPAFKIPRYATDEH